VLFIYFIPNVIKIRFYIIVGNIIMNGINIYLETT